MSNTNNKSNKKSNNEDSKSDAGEDIWNVGYNDGDHKDYDKPELREGQQLFPEEVTEASMHRENPHVCAMPTTKAIRRATIMTAKVMPGRISGMSGTTMQIRSLMVFLTLHCSSMVAESRKQGESRWRVRWL